MSKTTTTTAFTLINLIGIAVIFLGWWDIRGSYFLLDSILFVAIALLCMAMVWVVHVRVTRKGLLVYLAFAVWVLLSDALSGEFLPALARDVHWLIVPLVAVLYAQLFIRNAESFKVLQMAVAVSLIVICFRLIDGVDLVWDWVLLPIFGNVRHLGMTVGLMTVFLYHDAGYHRSEKRLLMLARIIGLGLLFWSGSRASMLAWGIAFCLLMLSPDQRVHWRFRCIEIMTAVALAIIFDVGNPYMGFVNAFFRQWTPGALAGMSTATIDQLSSSRLTLWFKSIDALRDPLTLLLGAGGNGFVRLHLMWDFQSFQPHNIILQILQDWGVGGLLLVVLLAKHGMSGHPIRKCKMDGRVLLGFALLAFLLVIGLLDAGLYHLQYLFFAGIAFALIGAPEAADVVTGADSPVRIHLPTVAIIVLLIAAVFLHWHLRNYRAAWPVSPLSKPYVAPERR